MRRIFSLFLFLILVNGTLFCASKSKTNRFNGLKKQNANTAAESDIAVDSDSSNEKKTQMPKTQNLGKNDLKEFINVETHFIFTQENAIDNKIVKIYGSTKDTAYDYRFLNYSAGEEVYMDIEFYPTFLKEILKKQKLSVSKLKEIEIPVFIKITNAEECKFVSTVNIDEHEEESEDNVKKYSFRIKNSNSEISSIRFFLTSKEVKKLQVFVNYGSADYKIVDEGCNVFETISFVSNQNKF